MINFKKQSIKFEPYIFIVSITISVCLVIGLFFLFVAEGRNVRIEEEKAQVQRVQDEREQPKKEVQEVKTPLRSDNQTTKTQSAVQDNQVENIQAPAPQAVYFTPDYDELNRIENEYNSSNREILRDFEDANRNRLNDFRDSSPSNIAVPRSWR